MAIMRIPGRDTVFLPWQAALISADNGRFYLDVVFNVSTASWTLLVRLNDAYAAPQPDALEDLVSRIACRPKRKNLNDIPEADCFWPKTMRLHAH